jgi:hypothetical protein
VKTEISLFLEKKKMGDKRRRCWIVEEREDVEELRD